MFGEMLTFTYGFGDNGLVVFTLATDDADLAEAVVDDIQSICGSKLERDGDYVYFTVEEDQAEDAVTELEETDAGVYADGYDAKEG